MRALPIKPLALATRAVPDRPAITSVASLPARARHPFGEPRRMPPVRGRDAPLAEFCGRSGLHPSLGRQDVGPPEETPGSQALAEPDRRCRSTEVKIFEHDQNEIKCDGMPKFMPVLISYNTIN